RRGQRDHPRDARGMAGRPHVAGDPAADAFRLADIKNFAIGGDHPVDAWPYRSMFPDAADGFGAMADRCRDAIDGQTLSSVRIVRGRGGATAVLRRRWRT